MGQQEIGVNRRDAENLQLCCLCCASALLRETTFLQAEQVEVIASPPGVGQLELNVVDERPAGARFRLSTVAGDHLLIERRNQLPDPDHRFCRCQTRLRRESPAALHGADRRAQRPNRNTTRTSSDSQSACWPGGENCLIRGAVVVPVAA